VASSARRMVDEGRAAGAAEGSGSVTGA
jgi:hypothetical protein